MVQPASRRLVTEAAAISTYAPLDDVVSPLRVEDLQFPVFIAHGAGGSYAPSNSLEGCRASIAMGCKVIEHDLNSLADGGLAVMHGPDLSTTTKGGAFNLADESSVSYQTLSLGVTSYPALVGQTIKPPLFTQLLTECAGQAILMPEIKDSVETCERLVTLVLSTGYERSVIVGSFNLDWLGPAIDAGLTCAYYLGGNTVDAGALIAAGITWIGIPTSHPTVQAQIDAANAGGLTVLIYTPSRQSSLSGLTGYDAVVSDHWTYQAGVGTRLSDPFAAQTFLAGMIPNTDSLGSKGIFAAPDTWGYTQKDAAFRGLLQGYLTPPVDPAAYTYTCDLRINSTLDTTKWGALFFAALGDYSYDSRAASGVAGYALILRSNGTLALYKVTDGTSTLIGTVASPALVEGVTWATVTVEVTATQIIVTRTDTSHTFTATDSTYRGSAVPHLGALGADVSFRNFSRTA